MNYKKGSLTVAATATVTNTSSSARDQLIFSFVPLRVGAATITSVTVNGRPATSRRRDMTLYVDLAVPLAVDATTVVRIDYTASLTVSTSVSGDRNGYFRKANGIVAAGRWIPWLSREVAFDRPTYGTPFVTGTAPVVNVSIKTGRAMRYATSGQLTSVSKDGLTHRFVARNVRDFVFAAAPDYKISTMQVGATTVTLYHRSFGAATVMKRARSAIDYYTAKIGPYPWPTLTIAETPGPKSAEWPASVWIATGNATKYIVAHEIAHQWFYGAIGNDQSEEPWADEGMADLLTRLHLGTLRGSTCKLDGLDRSIYEYTDACYFETIYVQGGQYLNSYRNEVGDELFWKGVQRYYADYLFKLGGTRQLLDTLDAVSGRARSHQARFPRYYE